jgi:serine/threonine protein phosphatase PrpC
VGLLHGLHRDAEVGQVVERVEDAEDVHAVGGGVFDEAGDDVVGVVGVADGVGAAEEHLEADVGHAGAELAQAFPRVLVEEAHRGVEGGAAPHFEGEEGGVRRARHPAQASMS